MNFLMKEDRPEVTEDNMNEVIDRSIWEGIPDCPSCGHKVERTEFGFVCVNADCEEDEVEL